MNIRNKRALLIESVNKNNIIISKEIFKQTLDKWIHSGLLNEFIIDNNVKVSVAELYESEASVLLREEGIIK